jgi:hypothetical protein
VENLIGLQIPQICNFYGDLISSSSCIQNHEFLCIWWWTATDHLIKQFRWHCCTIQSGKLWTNVSQAQDLSNYKFAGWKYTGFMCRACRPAQKLFTSLEATACTVSCSSNVTDVKSSCCSWIKLVSYTWTWFRPATVRKLLSDRSYMLPLLQGSVQLLAEIFLVLENTGR